MNRRDFLRILLATPLAATVDVEALLWVPKPIILVPALPYVENSNMGRIVAAAWEESIRSGLADNTFSNFWLLEENIK